MEQVSAQTEKITSYETSRTRRSLVDGSGHSDDSNNGDEHTSSEFYVREKSSAKKTDSPNNAAKGSESEVTEKDKHSEEKSSSLLQNGENSRNGEDSCHSKTEEKRDENDVATSEHPDDAEAKNEGKGDGNEATDDKELENEEKSDGNEATSEHTDDVVPENEEKGDGNEATSEHTADVEQENEEKSEEENKSNANQATEENTEETDDVSSSSNKNTDEGICNSPNNVEENSVSSTSNDEEVPIIVEPAEKEEVQEQKDDKSNEAENDLMTVEPMEEEEGQEQKDDRGSEAENNLMTVEGTEGEEVQEQKDDKGSEAEDDLMTVESTEEQKGDKVVEAENDLITAEPTEEKVQEKKGHKGSEAENDLITVEPTEKELQEQKGHKSREAGNDLITVEPAEKETVGDKGSEVGNESPIVAAEEKEEGEEGKDKKADEVEEVPVTVEPEEKEKVDERKDDKPGDVENESIIISDHEEEDRKDDKEDEPMIVEHEGEEEIKKTTGDKGGDLEKKKSKETEMDDDVVEVVPASKEESNKVGKGDEGSILKGQLEKASSNGGEDMDMDEDFDPSLLCPDISMDVDEAPVMTSTDGTHDDGSNSPLPYEPIFSTLVDEITGAEVQIDLTPEEMEMRQKMYGPDNPVQATKVHCTACNVHLGSALTGANNRFVHPLLKVLICKNCYHFYTSGEFEKDEDGSELYCRWCGQGGQVLCCSSCEFVFCKRCIRNNFGPKKFKQIRDSDDWNCFRCEPEQLSNLRASCAEFMEYYRTELARAQSLSSTNPELMTTDYTKCCSGEKKDDAKTSAPPKTRRKRKGDEADPDYKPTLDNGEPPAKKPAPSAGPGHSGAPQGSFRSLLPKAGSAPSTTTMRQVGTHPVRPQMTTAGGQVFKVGNTTFRTKTPISATGYTVQRPLLTQGPRNTNSQNFIALPPASLAKTATPGYIKIFPQRMGAPVRPTGSYTVVSGTNNGKPTFSTVRPAKSNQMPQMKHEWFEKTVRAAARVNSNLSYTLTQLNRQQSQAGSVEALAMVHNKLQEVLSTSINSLIQIRKNLRTEFIAGIKNIKFPPKPAPIPPTTGPIVVKDDDDVIFVSPTTIAAAVTQSQPPPLVISPAVTLTKKAPASSKCVNPFANPKPSTSGVKPNNSSGVKANNSSAVKANNASGVKPNFLSKLVKSTKPAVTTTTASTGPIKGGFLKVRSFTSLQTVPSECITIPDDPPAPADSVEDDSLRFTEIDPLKFVETIELVEIDLDKSDDKEDEKQPSPSPEKTERAFDEFMVYDVKEKPSLAIRKMMEVYVAVKKSPEVDQLLRTRGLMNGDSDRRESDGDVQVIESEENSAIVL